MLKRFVCLVVGSVVVLAVAGIAYGAATKIRWFDRVNEPNADADGMAILNYVQGQDNIVAQVILSDLLPSTAYVVALREPGTWELVQGTGEVLLDVTLDPVFPPYFFFPMSADNQETNSKGHLTFHGSSTQGSGDYSDSDVLIFLQSEWEAAFAVVPSPIPEDYKLPIPVRLIGDNPTPP